MTSRDLGYLEDMRVHASDAVSIARQLDLERFLADRPMQHAVIRCLTVIGEAANHVSSDTRIRLHQIEWGQAVALRNVLVHEYQRIDLTRIWQIVQDDILPLLAELNAHLGTIE